MAVATHIDASIHRLDNMMAESVALSRREAFLPNVGFSVRDPNIF